MIDFLVNQLGFRLYIREYFVFVVHGAKVGFFGKESTTNSPSRPKRWDRLSFGHPFL
jgi:hypothetical protein